MKRKIKIGKDVTVRELSRMQRETSEKFEFFHFEDDRKFLPTGYKLKSAEKVNNQKYKINVIKGDGNDIYESDEYIADINETVEDIVNSLDWNETS